jgi:glucans biosynthesis protein C
VSQVLERSNAESGGAVRYPAFDALRAICMFYIVFFHAAIAYGVRLPWSFHDPDANLGVTLAVLATMGWTLRVFFVMSGFFAHMIFARHGLREYGRHRLIRIGAPLLVVILIASSVLAALTDKPFKYVTLHAWFLQYLLVISFIVPVVHVALTRVAKSRPGKVMIAALDAAFPALVSSRWAPAVLALPLMAIHWVHNRTGSLQPTGLSLKFETPVLAYYTFFFGFGWLLFRHASVLSILAKRATVFLSLALVVRVIYMLMIMVWEADADRAPTSGQVAMVALSGLFTWLFVLGLIGGFQRWVRADGTFWRFISDSAYWSYLLHMVPVMLLQSALIRFDLSVAVKYLIVCLGAMAVCLVSYRYLVRYTVIGWVLNGKRLKPSNLPDAAGSRPTAPA